MSDASIKRGRRTRQALPLARQSRRALASKFTRLSHPAFALNAAFEIELGIDPGDLARRPVRNLPVMPDAEIMQQLVELWPDALDDQQIIRLALWPRQKSGRSG